MLDRTLKVWSHWDLFLISIDVTRTKSIAQHATSKGFMIFKSSDEAAATSSGAPSQLQPVSSSQPLDLLSQRCPNERISTVDLLACFWALSLLGMCGTAERSVDRVEGQRACTCTACPLLSSGACWWEVSSSCGLSHTNISGSTSLVSQTLVVGFSRSSRQPAKVSVSPLVFAD